jgi:hypothetical protein
MRKIASPTITLGFVLFALCSMAHARTIICESHDHRTQYCPADTRDGVQLVRQLSKSGCYEGETWGYDRRGIWVTEGCRAEFVVLDSPWDRRRDDRYDRGFPAYDDRRYRPHESRRRLHRPMTVTCESWDNREKYCRAPIRGAQVEIVRQLSNKGCRYGENWGWDEEGVWVTKGCRAVFGIH